MKYIFSMLFFLVLGCCVQSQETGIYTNTIADTVLSEDVDTVNASVHTLSLSDTQPKVLQNDPYLKPYTFWKNTPNWKRIGNNSILVGGLAVTTMVALYFAPESFTNWKRDELAFDKIWGKWYKNVSGGLVIDHDDLFLNWIAHPYCGAVYYMTARSAGFSAPLSFTCSFVMSTFFWEMGIESLAERPSLQDIIITPVGGALVGELFYLLKREIVANDYRVGYKFIGHTITFLLDPLNEIMDCIQGTWHKKSDRVSFIGFANPTRTFYGDLGVNFSLKLNF